MADPTIRQVSSNGSTGAVNPGLAPVAGNFFIIQVRHQNDADHQPSSNLGNLLPHLATYGPALNSTNYRVKFYGGVVVEGETGWTIPNMDTGGTRGFTYYELASTNGGEWRVVAQNGVNASAASTSHSPGGVEAPAESVSLAQVMWTSSMVAGSTATWSPDSYTRDSYDRYFGSSASRILSSAVTTTPSVTLSESKGAAIGVIVVANVVDSLEIGMKKADGSIQWFTEVMMKMPDGTLA